MRKNTFTHSLITLLVFGALLLLGIQNPGFSQIESDSPALLKDSIKDLTDKNQKVREKALDQLLASSHRDPSLLPVLVPLLSDPSSRIREQSVLLLGEIGSRDVIPEVVPLTKDSVARVRQASLLTLAQLGTEEAVPDVRKLLTDNNEDVALEAIQTLQHLGGEEAVKDLTEVAINGQSYRLRSAAIRALGEMGSDQPVSQLIVLMEYEKDIWLRLEIAKTLSKIGDMEVEKPILKTLEEIRREANQQTQQRRKEVYNYAADELEKALADLRSRKKQKKVARKKPAAKKPIPPPIQDSFTEPPQLEEQEKPKKKVSSSPPPTRARAKGKFTIQIKATSDGQLAQSLVDDLKVKGENGYIVNFEKDNQNWHRVRLGSFSSKSEAEDYAATLKAQNVIEDYFITR